MGEPIKLYRNSEQTTVYGPNQAATMLALGWADTPPVPPPAPPVADVQPVAASKRAPGRPRKGSEQGGVL